MVPLKSRLLSFSFVLLLLPRSATSTENCPVSYCGGLPVKFPFQVINSRASTTPRCVYPGFDLFCDNFLNQTVLFVPDSGLFIIQDINYDIQTLWISDPFNCLPGRFLEGFSVKAPFYIESFSNFTFYNCSSNITTTYRHRPIACLSSENHTVIAVPTNWFYDELPVPSSCEKIQTVSLPIPWGMRPDDLQDDVQLLWSDPFCGYCEQRGQSCGFKSKSGLEVGCSDHLSSASGMSKGTRYGIIFGVGVPGLLCIIGLGFLFCVRGRVYGQRNHRTTELSNVSIAPRPAVVTGLDGPTLDSYPKTLLGESGRLPKANDNTCPICLCEYQPKETLRTIPQCSHYFHANCIDEWLKMNASCPLCRHSPDGSSTSTSSPSSSSVSS